LQRPLLAALLAATALTGLMTAPARAIDLALMGSYWDPKDVGTATGAAAHFRFTWLDLRASYYPEFGKDDGLPFKVQATPLEAGITIPFLEEQVVSPYVGAGFSYVMLETDAADVKDQAGWYSVVGLDFGPGKGIAFCAEAVYRHLEAEFDPHQVDGPDDIETGTITTDLSGVTVNAGIVFRF
jgi:hypothetical protein